LGTAETRAILAAARALMCGAAPIIETRGLTLIGISVGNLADDDEVQLALPFDRPTGSLDVAVDEVRERFGNRALTRAVFLDTDHRPEMPLLPD
jgi:DNA polymerase-4